MQLDQALHSFKHNHKCDYYAAFLQVAIPEQIDFIRHYMFGLDLQKKKLGLGRNMMNYNAVLKRRYL